MSDNFFPNILLPEHLDAIKQAYQMAIEHTEAHHRAVIAAWAIRLYKKGLTDPKKLAYLARRMAEAHPDPVSKAEELPSCPSSV